VSFDVDFGVWGSVVSGERYDIPDSVVSRPDDDDTFTGDHSDGMVVAFNDDFDSFAVRISNNSEDFERIRVYDYDEGVYIYSEDISDKNSDDTVVIDQNVEEGIDYGVELDNDGSDWTVGFYDVRETYPYESEDVDIIATSRNAEQFTSDRTSTPRSINDIGNPDGVL